MPDRISRYRQVRFVIDLPSVDGHDAYWTALAVRVKKGIPHAEVLCQGRLSNSLAMPSVPEVRSLLDTALSDWESATP